jgi:MerR family transcriptional regulator, copper efflux regulator
MRIGELARRAGVNVQTVRFYEREGLIPCPDRSTGGYRCYSLTDLRRIETIRGLQTVGFTLRDIRELADLRRMVASQDLAPELRSSAKSKILKRAEDRLSALDQSLMKLQVMKREMERLVQNLAVPGAGADILGSI